MKNYNNNLLSEIHVSVTTARKKVNKEISVVIKSKSTCRFETCRLKLEGSRMKAFPLSYMWTLQSGNFCLKVFMVSREIQKQSVMSSVSK